MNFEEFESIARDVGARIAPDATVNVQKDVDILRDKETWRIHLYPNGNEQTPSLHFACKVPALFHKPRLPRPSQPWPFDGPGDATDNLRSNLEMSITRALEKLKKRTEQPPDG